MLGLFSSLLFFLLFSPIHGGNEDGTILLRDLLLSKSIEEAYQWMIQDAPAVAESSSHQISAPVLLMEAAKVVRTMPGGGGHAAMRAIQHYASTGKDEIAAYHFFMGQTVQYYCTSALQNTPEIVYCTNSSAGNEIIIHHYRQAYYMYKSYGFKGVDFDVSGMLNDLAILVQNYIGTEKEAIEIFEDAIEIAPDSVPPVVNLAAALRKFGFLKDPRVLDLLKRALKLSENAQISISDRAALHHNYATQLYELNIDGYIEAWEEAVRLNPFQFESHTDLASAYCSAGQMETASNINDNSMRSILELYTDNPNGMIGGTHIREIMLVILMHKTTTIIPQIFNSTEHSKSIRRQYISTLMVLDNELRELQLGWVDYRSKNNSLSASLERLGDLIKYANIVRSTQLNSSPLGIVGCGCVGYYLIYEGGVDILPRTLLARLYRSKFPELSYTAPFLRQVHAFDSFAAENCRKSFINFVSSISNDDGNATEDIDGMGNAHCHSDSSVVQTCEARDQRQQRTEQQKMMINKIPMSMRLPRVKIAFISGFWFHHSVGLLLVDVIAGISRNLFEVIIISISETTTVQLRDSKIIDENQMIVSKDIPVFIDDIELQESDVLKKVIIGGDEVTSKILNLGSRVYIFSTQNLKLMHESISYMELDVLVYGEVGMKLMTYFLAFSRLAARTVAFWGHATTSGISSSDIYCNDGNSGDNYEGGGIDYFISSHLFETEGRLAQRKYSERLVLMSGMVSSFPTPPPLQPNFSTSNIALNRVLLKREFLINMHAELQDLLPQHFTLYTVPQILHKVHPDFDDLLRLILMRDSKGYIVVPRGNQRPRWLHILQDRLKANIGDTLLQRIIYLRYMNTHEYLTLNSVSDVVLDTFPVGGGRSSFEIFSVATPIVVLYPRTSILQLTTGMYKTMGFFDQDNMLHHHVVTHTRDDFVKAATEMANNETKRELVRDLIDRNKARLYTPTENSNTGINRWEPNSLEDMIEYLNDDFNLHENGHTKFNMHHSAKIIQEWNKLLLFLGSYSKDVNRNRLMYQRRGWDYKQALSLREDIKFQLSKDGQYLEVMVDEGEILE